MNFGAMDLAYSGVANTPLPAGSRCCVKDEGEVVLTHEPES